MLQPGMLIEGRYRIIRQLGRGGTSCVYLAENIRIGNKWAVKEVFKNQNGIPITKSGALIAESSILTKLSHPGLPSIIDVSETRDSYLIIMEYIEGVSLDKVLENSGAQSEKDVIKWAKQLCDVLEYLHSCKPPIIYRDMKPSNIMLKPDGNVMLIDFGIAREYKTKSIKDTNCLGTYGYAAPEQCDGSGQTDQRTDIYSLGVTLQHLVTGKDPCSVMNMTNSGRQRMFSAKFAAIINKCMQIEADKRYQSVHELKAALNELESESAKVFIDDEPKKSNSSLVLLAIIPVAAILIIGIIVAATSFSSSNFSDKTYYGSSYSDDDNYVFKERLESLNYVSIENPDQLYIYEFTPKKSGRYLFTSESEKVIPCIWIYDYDINYYDGSNTEGDYREFALNTYLSAGETYYICTTVYNMRTDFPQTGDYWMRVEKID